MTLSLSDDELTRIRRLAGLPAQAELRPIAGGYSNANFRVETGSSAKVLRVYRDAGLAPRERLIHRLIRETVPVAEIITVLEGASSGGHDFALMEFVEGNLLSDLLEEPAAPDLDAAGVATGETLAHIGRFGFTRPGFFDENLVPTGLPVADESIAGYVRDQLRVDVALSTLGAAVVERFLTILESEVANLNAIGPQQSLVHCDFNPKNILMSRYGSGWRVAAVLDWEFAFSGSPLWDVANMLRFEDRYPPEFVGGFESGFLSAGGSLPPDWRRLGRIIDTVNLATFISKGQGAPYFQQACELVMRVVSDGHF